MALTLVLSMTMVLLTSGIAVAERYEYRECYNLDDLHEPLGRTIPLKYNLLMLFDIDNSVAQGTLSLTMRLDDSKSQREEPKNYIALNMDKRVQVDSVDVFRETSEKEIVSVTLKHICYDAREELLLIQTWKDMEGDSKIHLSLTVRSPMRFGDEGLHRVYDDANVLLARASFANSQARRIIPCFDDPKHETTLEIGLVVPPNLDISSDSCDIKSKRLEFGRRIVEISEEQPVKLDKLSFDLKRSNDPVSGW